MKGRGLSTETGPAWTALTSAHSKRRRDTRGARSAVRADGPAVGAGAALRRRPAGVLGPRALLPAAARRLGRRLCSGVLRWRPAGVSGRAILARGPWPEGCRKI